VSYTLEAPAGPEDWQAFHDIREAVLFRARHPGVVYDRNHPDDFTPANRPLLFKRDRRPIGTIRLDDFGNGTGAVRLVAIAKTEQGKGHGRIMDRMCVDLARRLGMHTLFVNAVPESVGFYEKTGWEIFSWNPDELVSIAACCVQMRKRIG
jgi:N-acetylglutamate synthase-like GNAT family acetyltransferase